MSNIKILSEHVSNKIAAGEVIERPASVVKELIENSIDAKAKRIFISVENAGRKTIAVTDDGCGMDADDAILCFEPHATSKISREEDISNIVTMGFRGEALPSIASVSRVRLRTRKREMLEGSEVVIHGGVISSESTVGCAVGTEIIVSDLFFNIPARKKFLKSNVTEEAHVYDVIYLLALANPEISFEYKLDGKVIISTAGGDNLLARVGHFLGKQVIERSVSAKYSQDGISVGGYISTPDLVRNSRREQRIFINRRPIRANVVYHAVKEAYGSMVMKDLYPVIILFIDLDPREVDINVHPAKYEARFRNEKLIYETVYNAIRNALQKTIKPPAAVKIQHVPISSVLNTAEVKYSDVSIKSEEPKIEPKILNAEPNKIEIQQKFSNDLNKSEKPLFFDKLNNRQDQYEGQKNVSSVGFALPGCDNVEFVDVLDNTYVLCKSRDGLLVVDQHAAHERILFERLLNEPNKNNLVQKLLLPITVNLNRQECNFITKYQQLFNDLGFELEVFGENTILISAIPVDFPMENISGLISDLVDELINERDFKKYDATIIAQTACKYAVKAHDPLSSIEIKELIDNLLKCELPYSCPHGRPTIINISFKELEKRFGRKV